MPLPVNKNWTKPGLMPERTPDRQMRPGRQDSRVERRGLGGGSEGLKADHMSVPAVWAHRGVAPSAFPHPLFSGPA